MSARGAGLPETKGFLEREVSRQDVALSLQPDGGRKAELLDEGEREGGEGKIAAVEQPRPDVLGLQQAIEVPHASRGAENGRVAVEARVLSRQIEESRQKVSAIP